MASYWPPQPSNNLWVGNNYTTGSRTPPPTSTPMAYQNMPVNNIFSVMGPKGAEEFKVGPNSHVILVDMDDPVVYIKRSDDSGYSKIRAFKIEEIPFDVDPRPTHNEEQAASLYLTKEEFADFKREMQGSLRTIEDLVMNHE